MKATPAGPATAPLPAPAGGRDDDPHHTAPHGPAAGQPLLEQAFGLRTLCALRAAAHARAVEAGMPRARADDLTLAVHELAANAVQHGAGHGRLLMWYRDGTLVCQIEDDGPAVQPGQDPAAPGGNAAARWPSAQPHGLWLVRALADQMTITSGTAGTCATAAFTLLPAT